MSLYLKILAFSYQGCKNFFFLFDPEIVHECIVRLGEFIGSIPPLKSLNKLLFVRSYPSLSRKIGPLTFKTPIGLAAGFDYEARLTQVLPSIGFGFQTIGTITNAFGPGNAKPRLGRLPKSKSLLVNKGFKNPGADAIIKKLEPLQFSNMVGVSIGQSTHVDFHTHQDVIEDILNCFKKFENSKVKHSYYELNISCPNLHTSFNFYNHKNLDQLLTHVDALKLKKPVFIKMPISESDETVLSLLKVITKHSPIGIIIGNLQKNRKDPAVLQSEIMNKGPGNLSGKPTFERSNHLIQLAYKQFNKQLIIIGCGGVFSAEDAYIKICLGASLIQMITGLIFQGPQVVAQINLELAEMLKKNGYTQIQDAVGSKA